MAAEQPEAWRYDPDLGDGRRGWIATVGPWSLGVFEDTDGRITWSVDGPIHLGEGAPLAVDGTALTVEDARVQARDEVRLRLKLLTRVLEDLEGDDGYATRSKEIRRLFHTLWTRDRHGGEYVKREWQRLGELLADRGVGV